MIIESGQKIDVNRFVTVVDGAIGTRNGVASAFKPRLEYQQGSQMT